MATTTKKAKPAARKPSPAAEALKNLYYAGLGLVDETNEKMHESFHALVKKGQEREPELKRAAEDIRRKAVAQRKELEKKFTGFIRQNEIVKSKEFQSLLKKLEALEVKPSKN